MMGDEFESPVHAVRIVEPFAVGVHEVTFAEWDACHSDGGCTHNPRDVGGGRSRWPAINVSWNDTQAYVPVAFEEDGAAVPATERV